jgi:vibriolysin
VRLSLLVVLSILACGAAFPQTRPFTTGTPEELERAGSLGLAHLTAWARQRAITDELRVTRVNVDAVSMAHVRVQQFHRNIPVLGGEAIAHLKATGEPFGQTDDLLPNVKVDTAPRLTADAAVGRARAEVGCRDCSLRSADLWIVRTEGTDHLAYRVELRESAAGPPLSIPIVFVDAHSGNLILRYDNLQTGK